jgi:hypothetical protein
MVTQLRPPSTPRRRSINRALFSQPFTRAGLVAGAVALCLGALACENICTKAGKQFRLREEVCYGIDDYGPVPDDLECAEEEARYEECLYQCYLLPCNTAVGDYNECISDCSE